MILNSQGVKYKSPIRKLLAFFQKSRDKWKEKCQLANVEIKRYKNKIYFLEKRKSELKRRVKELEAEKIQLQRKLSLSAYENESLKKK